MGQMWAKNFLFYPKAYSDEQMKDIPYPRVELYDHVVTKATQVNVAFWVTNPCRITRKVKQTKMYVCTLEEFILVDLDTLLCKLELICIGKCCSLYTVATMDEKCENCS